MCDIFAQHEFHRHSSLCTEFSRVFFNPFGGCLFTIKQLPFVLKHAIFILLDLAHLLNHSRFESFLYISKTDTNYEVLVFCPAPPHFTDTMVSRRYLQNVNSHLATDNDLVFYLAGQTILAHCGHMAAAFIARPDVNHLYVDGNIAWMSEYNAL